MGSLYNALYGTNVIPQDNDDNGKSSSSSYNPIRGQKVISYGRTVLNQALPLVGTNNTHDDSIHYAVDIKTGTLQVTLENGTITTLQDETQFLGYQPHENPMKPTHLLFQHKHGLRLEIQIDRTNEIGSFDKAGICDIILEAAVTTIMDLEDSVATVDATDKVVAYKNWLGLLQGNLTACITKNDKTFVRSLNPDRVYTNPRIYERSRKIFVCKKKCTPIGQFSATRPLSATPRWEFVVHTNSRSTKVLHTNSTKVLHTNSTKVLWLFATYVASRLAARTV